MRAVIISGGRITDYAYIKSQINESDTIICADSGYDHAVKLGIKISAVVGDFDSISGSDSVSSFSSTCGYHSDNIPADIPIIRYPPHKDLTDTEIAIEYARGKGFMDFLLLAATGGRMDHCLTNILLLKGFLERGETATIIDEHSKIRLTNSKLCIHEAPGAIVSLVPLTDCDGVCTEGLAYPLHEANLRMGRGLGVSNIAVSQATVSLRKGLLLVIIARD